MNNSVIRLLRELIKEEINQIKPFLSFSSPEKNPSGHVARLQDPDLDPELMDPEDPDMMDPEEKEDLAGFPMRSARS